MDTFDFMAAFAFGCCVGGMVSDSHDTHTEQEK